MQIGVFGIGPVGLSLATSLALKSEVILFDIDKTKVDLINNKKSPINEQLLNEYFATKSLNLIATTNYGDGCKNANFIIVCVPTNLVNKTNQLDTSIVDSVVGKAISINPDATIVIKSTVPVGFTRTLKEKYNIKHILFCPEFLRENSALQDTLNPSRIVIGFDDDSKLEAERFASLIKESILNDALILMTGLEEAESIKLFSNTYLALRVSFFNEIDSFAIEKGIDARDIIKGMSLDPRIGDFYNNPSFGYSGTCLVKDVLQASSDLKAIDSYVVDSINKSNEARKDYITEHALALAGYKPEIANKITIGIYRLSSKKDSANFKHSASIDIMERLRAKGVKVIIYEPTLHDGDEFFGSLVVNNLEEFKKQSKVIVANRYNDGLDDVANKLICRDHWKRD